MKNFKKLVAMGLTAVMAVSAMSISALAEENDTVYTYMDENGNVVNITQAELDAEHWNTDMLGKTIPLIYKDFPMKISSFTNDFGELSLDLEYMKKIDDITSVNLEIKNMDDNTIIYNQQISVPSFYSPELDIDGQYSITLTETIDGETSAYNKIVFVNKTEADLPEYVKNPTADDESKILVGDIDKLREGIITDENGNMTVNGEVADYDTVKACDFHTYCDNLPPNKTYRIYAKDNGKQYAGYMSTHNNRTELYGLDIDIFNPEDLNRPALYSAPTGVTFEDVQANAVRLTLTDASFHLRELSNNTKYAAYKVSVPDRYFSGDDNGGNFTISIASTNIFQYKIWRDNGREVIPVKNSPPNSGTTDLTYPVITDNFYDTDYLTFYVLINFKNAVDGYGIINFSNNTSSSYEDNITGSVSEAYGAMHESLSNTEYSLADAWDVDAFGMEHTKANSVFKIDIKNRSLADQAKLEAGQWISGSSAKCITLWSFITLTGTLSWEEDVVYSIPKNTDMTIYAPVSRMWDYVFTVHSPANTGWQDKSYYQLQYSQM